MKKSVLIFLFCVPMILHAQGNLQLVENKSATCVACHGEKGVSPNSAWPNIAGQHQDYLLKQLIEMKQANLRSAPVMTAVLAGLDEKDMRVLASYYAKMPIAEGYTLQQYVARGEQLYRGGDFKKQITACIACHGPKGTGNGQAGFPLLTGQHAAYTLMQLQAFKEGKRKNDLNHIMQDISSKMSQEDMDAVAHYIEGLY